MFIQKLELNKSYKKELIKYREDRRKGKLFSVHQTVPPHRIIKPYHLTVSSNRTTSPYHQTVPPHRIIKPYHQTVSPRHTTTCTETPYRTTTPYHLTVSSNRTTTLRHYNAVSLNHHSHPHKTNISESLNTQCSSLTNHHSSHTSRRAFFISWYHSLLVIILYHTTLLSYNWFPLVESLKWKFIIKMKV